MLQFSLQAFHHAYQSLIIPYHYLRIPMETQYPYQLDLDMKPQWGTPLNTLHLWALAFQILQNNFCIPDAFA